jgi:membrane-associated phospholipid phosphatase
VASVHSESLGPAAVSLPVRRESADVTAATSAEDLLEARPGGLAEWCGDRLRALPPWAAALTVAVVGWAALAALMIGIGVLLVEVLIPGPINDWDGSVVRTFVEARESPLTDASVVGSGLAETLVVVTAGLVLSAILLAKRAWQLLGLVVLSLVIEVTVYAAVTAVIHRQRPIVEQLEQRRQGASFPSGHTAAAFVLYFSIAAVVAVYASRTVWRRVAWVAVVLVPVIVAVSRIYRGMHNPTDAAAGLIMGIGSVVVALTAVRAAGLVAERRRTGGRARS